MAIATYKKIASVTVGSGGASNIQFSSIPPVYDDLVLKISVRSLRSSWRDGITFRINNSTSNFSYRMLEVTGAGTPGSYSGSTGSLGNVPGDTNTAYVYSNSEIYFPNYASNTNKSYSGDLTQSGNDTTNQTMGLLAGLWSNTSIISSISFSADNGNLAQYSTATLYGIIRSN